MLNPKYVIASSVIGGLVLVAAITATALTGQPANDTARSDAVQVVFEANATEDGICRPDRIATVNKEALGLAAVYGDAVFSDARNGGSTDLPLQLVFSGWDSQGMSEDRVTTGINTETPCADLRIAYTIKECLYDDSRPEPMACPEIELTGEGFSELVIKADESQALPQRQ